MKGFLRLNATAIFVLFVIPYIFATENEHLFECRILLKSNCYAELIEYVEQVDSQSVNNFDYMNIMLFKADAQLFSNQLNEAFTTYFSLNKRNLEGAFKNKVISRIAYVFYLGGDYEKCLEFLDEISHDEKRLWDKMLVIRSYRNMEDFEKALKLVEFYLEEGANNTLVEEKNAVLIKAAKYNEAAEGYRFLLEYEEDEKDYSLYNNLLYCLNKVDLVAAGELIDFVDLFIYDDAGASQVRKAIYTQNKAEFLSRSGCHIEAMEMIDVAIKLYFDLESIGDLEIKTCRDKHSLLDFYDEKIRIHKAAKSANVASCYQVVDEIISWINLEAIEENVHFRKAEDFRSYYLDAFQYFRSQNDLATAYAFLSKIKDSALSQELLLTEKEDFIEMTSRKELQQQIITDQSNRELKNKRRLAALEELIQNSSNEHFKTLGLTQIDTKGFQNKLDNKTVVVDYFLLDTISLVFYISKSKIEVFELKVERSDIEKFKAMCSTKPSMKTWDAKGNHVIDQLGMQLYSELLPVNINGFQNVVFIPHGVLNGFSFDALKYGRAFLIQRHDISYASSIFICDHVYGKEYHTDDKAYVGQEDGMKLSGSGIEREALQNKGYTRLTSKSDLFGLTESFNVLHFSNHGERGTNFYNQFINLSEDEKLYSSDFYFQNLQCNLVVLAGCETGVGELVESEGMIALSRACLRAGTKSVVSTNYKVNDATTQQIIMGMYDNLEDGKTITHSLSESKRDFLTNQTAFYLHPYFWSGIKAEGNPIMKIGHKKTFASKWLAFVQGIFA